MLSIAELHLIREIKPLHSRGFISCIVCRICPGGFHLRCNKNTCKRGYFHDNTRKLTLDDLWAFKVLGYITSPDGRRVAFVMHSTDKATNERQSAIWLLQLDEQGMAGGEPRQLTSGVKNDTQPAWAPDSRHLLFISDREGEKSQFWLIDTDGGEARKLTTMLNGVSEAAWSPDGQWIAFTAMVAPTDDDRYSQGANPWTKLRRKNATRKSVSVSAPSRRSGTVSMGAASSRNSTSFLSCLLPVMAR